MVKIIEASQDHINDIAPLLNNYQTFCKVPCDITSTADFLKELFLRNTIKVILAYQDSKAIGFILTYPSYSSVAMKQIWALNDLYIDEAYRRKGIAREMLNYLESLAKLNKIFSIKLTTEISNEPARMLYKAMGYQLNKTFLNYGLLIK